MTLCRVKAAEIQGEGLMSLWDIQPVKKKEREQGEDRTSQIFLNQGGNM